MTRSKRKVDSFAKTLHSIERNGIPQTNIAGLNDFKNTRIGTKGSFQFQQSANRISS